MLVPVDAKNKWSLIPENERSLILKVLEAANSIFDSNHWVLSAKGEGIDPATWRRLKNRNEPPSPGGAESIAKGLWNKTKSSEALVQRVYATLQKLDPHGAPREITERSLCEYFYAQAKMEKDALSSAIPGKTVQPPTPLDHRGDTGNIELYTTFWDALHGKRVAMVLVRASKYHYDVAPMCELVKHVTVHIDSDAEFLFFDEHGKPQLPKQPDYDTFQAFSFLGRIGVYTSCEIYETYKKTLQPATCFSLPAVGKSTRQYVKGKPSPEFHRVDNHSGEGPSYFFAKDEINTGDRKKRRTDYALIQRLFVPEDNTFVLIFAGCTALGTEVAVKQATKDMFSKVPGALSLKNTDNVEILLQVTGSLDWTDEDEKRFQEGELLTKEWDAKSVPWFVCVNKEVRYKAPGAVDMSSRDALRSEFMNLRDLMEKRYRYSTSKYSVLLRACPLWQGTRHCLGNVAGWGEAKCVEFAEVG